MPVTYKKKVAVLAGHCEIEEAETLFSWLTEDASRQLNLKTLTTAHTAVFQVLLCLRPKVSVQPESSELYWIVEMLQSDNNKVWCE